MEAAALGVILPVLLRGLNSDRTDVKRKCCVVIENMCKLVEHPREVPRCCAVPLISGTKSVPLKRCHLMTSRRSAIHR